MDYYYAQGLNIVTVDYSKDYGQIDFRKTFLFVKSFPLGREESVVKLKEEVCTELIIINYLHL